MRLIIQRVSEAQVFCNKIVIGQIQEGLLVFVCFEIGDQIESIEKALAKIQKLRIFDHPETGKMDLSLQEIQGSLLIVSQFTLSWRGKGGNRPSFEGSLEPAIARKFYNLFVEKCREFAKVETGQFGEHMQVKLTNNGPVTLILEY